MKKAGDGIVSFVFTCDVEGKEIEPEEKENKPKEMRRHTTLGLPRKMPAYLGNRQRLEPPKPISGLRKRKPEDRSAHVLTSVEAVDRFSKLDSLLLQF